MHAKYKSMLKFLHVVVMATVVIENRDGGRKWKNEQLGERKGWSAPVN